MGTSKLVDQAADFLNVATYRKSPAPVAPVVESKEVVAQRLHEASENLNRMFGFNPNATKTAVIDQAVNKHLNRFKQDCLTEGAVNESYGDVKYALGSTTPEQQTEKSKLLAAHAAKIAALKTKMEAATDNDTYHKLKDAHDLEAAMMANTQAFMKGKVNESVENAVMHMLEQMNIPDFCALNESMQAEIISIATDVAPYL